MTIAVTAPGNQSKSDFVFAGRCARTLELLAAIADRGQPCPSNREIAEVIGVTGGTQVTRVLDGLVERGLIVVRRRSNHRQITVRATGKSTADIGEGPATGEALAERVREAAVAVGVPLRQFAAPLSSEPIAFLDQLARARQPRAHTIARVHALLAGEPVPPPPSNNFQREGRLSKEVAAEASEAGQRRSEARSLGSARTSLAAFESDEPRPILAATAFCGRCGARDGTACGCRGRAIPASIAAAPGAKIPPRPQGRPRTFEEQLAAVAAGAGLIEVQPLHRAGPDRTLGGVGSGML